MDTRLEPAAALSQGANRHDRLQDGGTRSPDGDCETPVAPEAAKEPQDWGVLTGWRMIAQEVINELGETGQAAAGDGWMGAANGTGEQQRECDPPPQGKWQVARNRIQSVVAKS
eukprot:evm.model.scf_1853.3 EVM.evm.TU.scf_1853.3   scf_1853:27354-27694(+)